MKKRTVIVLFLILSMSCFSQKMDLIVTTEADSIACKILEVNDSEILFTMTTLGRKNVRTILKREKIAEYSYDVINKDMFIFKPGTSYIIGKTYQIPPGTSHVINRKTYSVENLQNATGEELEYYLYKAKKLQKTGRTFNIIGASFIGLLAGTVILENAAHTDPWGTILVGIIAVPAAGASFVIGIPTNLTGKNRVERINTIKGTGFNDVGIDLQPCIQYNLSSQNYQPGITLKIRF